MKPTAVILVAVSYALLGLLSLRLAIPPGYATPVFPSAGIGLAAALLCGRCGLVAVFLGTLLLQILKTTLAGAPLPPMQLLVLLPAGAMLQAWLSARLVHRTPGFPNRLDTVRTIVPFLLLAGPVGCLVNASLSVPVLVVSGTLPASTALDTWWTWWLGDAVGVMVATPILLALFARPRTDWHGRRAAIVVPMLIANGLVTLAIVQIGKFERERITAAFEREAIFTRNALTERFSSQLLALEAAHALMETGLGVDARHFERFAAGWLGQLSGLRAIGWSTRVPAAERAAFEARSVERGNAPGFRIVDRDVHDRLSPAAPADAYFAITYIEPMANNRRALGLNQLSVPAARTAITRAIDSGRPAASAGFALTQSPDQGLGVVVYRRVDAPERTPGDPPLGVVFATLQLDEVIGGIAAVTGDRLEFCLHDATEAAEAAPRWLAGAADCEARFASAVHRMQVDIPFADRSWRLSLAAKPRFAAIHGSWAPMWISIGALVSVGLLGAFLLITSGRARRVEELVASRTAALRHEVAERRTANAALRESEQLLRTMFETSSVGMIYCGLDGRYLKVNRRFLEITRRTEAEVLSMTIPEMTWPEDRVRDAPAVERLMSGRSDTYHTQKRYQRGDGTPVDVEIFSALHRDASGRPQHTVGIVLDNTAARQLLAAQRARAIAEAANRAKTDFLSRMSHELRTPLNALLGFAQLLRSGDGGTLSERQQQRVAGIERAGWHLLDMIDDVLDLSRIENGSLKVRLQPLRLRPLVDECAHMLRQRLVEAGLDFDTRFDTQGLEPLGDATRVRQVLTNLLDNAIKYSRRGGRIELVVTKSGARRLDLTVRDDGIGMSDEQMARLFEPFDRLGREDVAPGTGIGLVITRRLVTLMGGSMTVTSRAGEGSAFTVHMPAVARPEHAAEMASADGAAADAARGLRAAAAAGSTAAGSTAAGSTAVPDAKHVPVDGHDASDSSDASGPSGTTGTTGTTGTSRMSGASRSDRTPVRVVYVEDNRLNAAVVRDMLMQHGHADVQVFEEPAEALAAVPSLMPDLVLLDLNLPGMDGLELLRRLKDDPRTCDIPVAIVSADALPDRIDAAFSAGAADYLTKPLNMDTLLVLVEQCADRTDVQPAEPSSRARPVPESDDAPGVSSPQSRPAASRHDAALSTPTAP